jgi:hypothetical protein
MAESMETGQRGSHGSPSGGVLRAQLAIEPHPDAGCAVVEQGEDAQDVNQHLKVDQSRCGDGTDGAGCGAGADATRCGECHTEMAFDDGEEDAYLKSAVGTNCVCLVFEHHDCIPQITAVRSGAIVVTLTVASRGVLREIIDDLRGVGASVTVDWLVAGSTRGATTEIDVSSITDKQREAMELALDSGYYETPRETDLGELATELDVSESAASQRLNAAETKLVKSYLDD